MTHVLGHVELDRLRGALQRAGVCMETALETTGSQQ